MIFLFPEHLSSLPEREVKKEDLEAERLKKKDDLEE
jgi:hypothetical protein